MANEFSRRSVITVGALAFIDTAITGCSKAQAAPQTPESAKTPSSTQAPESAKTGTADPKGEQGAATRTRTASCNCGQLRVTCKGPDPERISMCHCHFCKKQTGSVFAVQARFPKEQLTIEGRSTTWKFPIAGAEPVKYRNCVSGGATFHFCPECGSTVYYEIDADPARLGVRIGAFADPTFPAPKVSGFEEYRHPWAMNAAAVPMQHVE